MGLIMIIVRCWRGKELLAAYELPCGESLGPTSLPDRAGLIAEAQTNLTNERLAGPPYDGIRFEVVYP
jgi:hypothetical protein